MEGHFCWSRLLKSLERSGTGGESALFAHTNRSQRGVRRYWASIVRVNLRLTRLLIVFRWVKNHLFSRGSYHIFPALATAGTRSWSNTGVSEYPRSDHRTVFMVVGATVTVTPGYHWRWLGQSRDHLAGTGVFPCGLVWLMGYLEAECLIHVLLDAFRLGVTDMGPAIFSVGLSYLWDLWKASVRHCGDALGGVKVGLPRDGSPCKK